VSADVSVSSDLRGSTLWISLSGEVDLSNSAAVEDRIRASIVPPAERVALDLSKVAFMDSSGLRIVLTLADRLRERRRELILIVPPGGLVRRVLAISGADAVVPIVATAADVPGSELA